MENKNMKKLITIVTLIIVSAISAFAQTSDEKEILKFIADYDQAYINMDIEFLEKNTVEESTFSYNGTLRTRAQTIEGAKKEKANPTEKIISWKTESDSVRVAGNFAVVSGSWTWSAVSLDNPQSEPHVDKGRYTLVLEKRSGRWMIISEHQSEQSHDKKLMESQVLKMGLEAASIYKNRNYGAMERIVADDAVFINTMGKVQTKSEMLAELKNSRAKVESVEITDQKVRVLGNGGAIETGLVRYKGTGSDGKAFDETERYTTIWAWRNLRWQIVSDHTSEVKK